jgi:DNA-binding NarL/FixJ family response regulator
MTDQAEPQPAQQIIHVRAPLNWNLYRAGLVVTAYGLEPGSVTHSGIHRQQCAIAPGGVRGELVCSPKVAASLYHSIGFSRAAIANRTAMAAANPLTTRELQVADLMNRGCATKGNCMAPGSSALYREEPH